MSENDTEKTKRPRFNPKLADPAKLVEAKFAETVRVSARGEMGGAKYVPEHDEYVIKPSKSAWLAAFDGDEKSLAGAITFAFNLFLKRAGAADPTVEEKRQAYSTYRKNANVLASGKLKDGSIVHRMTLAAQTEIEAAYPNVKADLAKAAKIKAAKKAEATV